jgi:LAO/AO transport system kinase
MYHPENQSIYKGLKVNRGVAAVPTVNPYFKRHKQDNYTSNDFVEAILKGDVAMLGQAVTLIESSLPEHHKTAQEIIEKCLPYTSKSIRVGITGVPGAGKSTTIDALGINLIKKGHKVAVLAIDPSSERSHGSILGDKTRMELLSREKNAFIRPSPTAGSLGGVARKTRETIILCEAAGFGTIIVETVGVGQSEIAVHSMVDFFLLLQLAGTGDELQGIKRGIMEMADGIAINKADGNNIEKAKLAAANFRNALHLFPPTESGWIPKVMTYSGYYTLGIDELWKMVNDYIIFTKRNGYFERKRNEQAKFRMYESINYMLHDTFYHRPEIEKQLPIIEQKVLNKEISSFVAAKKMIDLFVNQ